MADPLYVIDPLSQQNAAFYTILGANPQMGQPTIVAGAEQLTLTEQPSARVLVNMAGMGLEDLLKTRANLPKASIVVAMELNLGRREGPCGWIGTSDCDDGIRIARALFKSDPPFSGLAVVDYGGLIDCGLYGKLLKEQILLEQRDVYKNTKFDSWMEHMGEVNQLFEEKKLTPETFEACSSVLMDNQVQPFLITDAGRQTLFRHYAGEIVSEFERAAGTRRAA